jgi:hypothetical protein
MLTKICLFASAVVFGLVLLSATSRGGGECSLEVTAARTPGFPTVYRFTCPDEGCPPERACVESSYILDGWTHIYCSCDGQVFPDMLKCAAWAKIGPGGSGLDWGCDQVNCDNPCFVITEAMVPDHPAKAPVCYCL